MSPCIHRDESKLRANTGELGCRLALAHLEPAHRGQDEAARKKPEQERHDLDAETGQDCPFVRHQAAIGIARDIGGGDVEDRGIDAGRKARAGLKLGRDRARAKYGDADAVLAELAPRGVRVTVLCPGPVPTEFQARAGVGSGHDTALLNVSATQVAREAYRGLMANKRAVLPGLGIKIVPFALRFFPRGFILSATARFQRQRH